MPTAEPTDKPTEEPSEDGGEQQITVPEISLSRVTGGLTPKYEFAIDTSGMTAGDTYELQVKTDGALWGWLQVSQQCSTMSSNWRDARIQCTADPDAEALVTLTVLNFLDELTVSFLQPGSEDPIFEIVIPR